MVNKIAVVIACINALFNIIPASSNDRNQIDHRNKVSFIAEVKTDIVIILPSAHDELMQQLQNTEFPGRTDTLEYIRDTLMEQANQTQGPIKTFLEQCGISFKATWINNQIFAHGVTNNIVKDLLEKFAEIKEIRRPYVFQLNKNLGEANSSKGSLKYSFDCPPLNGQVTWGLEKIEVPRVWKELGINGSKIVVGSIDSGVRITHEALKQQYLVATHSWFDPVDSSELPMDSDGHGTHTIGTMVGLNNIGVAPGAKFIACRGGDADSCTEQWLLACGEFMLCPTRPDGSDADCSRAPHVINFSIGGIGGVMVDTFQDMTDYWQASNIVPVFAIGNEGSGCNTTGSPGNYIDNISVGACDSNDKIAWFSSRGPAPYDRYGIKPDITAPGVGICSASSSGDSKYRQLDGTSMAAPHISGIVALILSINPGRRTTVDEVKNILYSSTSLQTDGLQTNDGTWTCNANISIVDGRPIKDNYFGYGISIAYKAVKNAMSWFRAHP